MNLTKEEKRFLGKQTKLVAHSAGSIIIWRWLHAITPFRPRSLAELYTTALRRLRHRVSSVLEAEGYAGNCADWILNECLYGSGDEQLLRRLQRELSITLVQARSCLDRIHGIWSRLPCSQQPAWEELGHYAWAEAFIQTMTRTNETGTFPDELLHPIPASRLTAVSHLAFSQSYVAAAGDPTAEAKLIDHLLIRLPRLVQALSNHMAQGQPAPVFWNLPAFYAGTKSASDLAELQSYAELLILLKTFAAVEYRIIADDGDLSQEMTIALCNIFWMVVGHLDSRSLQTLTVSLSLCCPVKRITLSGVEKRDDYIQALFHMNLSHLIPYHSWRRPALLFFRTSLALPRINLSRFEWLALLISAGLLLYSGFSNPRSGIALLLLILLLFVCYISMRGGLDFVIGLFERMLHYIADRHPLLLAAIVFISLIVMFLLDAQ